LIHFYKRLSLKVLRICQIVLKSAKNILLYMLHLLGIIQKNLPDGKLFIAVPPNCWLPAFIER